MRADGVRDKLRYPTASLLVWCIVFVSLTLMGSVGGCGRKGPLKPLKERPPVNVPDNAQ